ncbi:MAG: heparinase II/III family protein [Nitrococcus sp.]|nr:heparinase II/III family protein [Nitrococcus sp.]
MWPWRFRFLNHEADLESAMVWTDSKCDKLWLYNLHYFDDLNAVEAEKRTHWHRELIERWIEENEAGRGVGWEPYPSSLRIVNWTKWVLAGNLLPGSASQSLAVQTRWLSKRLEHHLPGNHLFANAKALVFAGLLFEGGEAEQWFSLGLKLLGRELPEQVLPDGGNFELSPMYHHVVLEDVMDVINVVRVYGQMEPPEWAKATERMLDWAIAMVHPDGDISFFNDAALGVAPTLSELCAYAVRLGIRVPKFVDDRPVVLLPHSGYVRLQRDHVVAFFDVGKVGPDYLPGHAHADTLSVEVSVGTQRVLVNSGTSIYGTGAERQRQRGTAAHSTIRIDREDSSEVWAGFRVARRAYVHDVEIDPAGAAVSAWHDGYLRLCGKPKHGRTVCLRRRELEIRDSITSKHNHLIEGTWHLHPAVEVVDMESSETSCRVLLRILDRGVERSLVMTIEGADHVAVEAGTYHPEFGLSQSTHCVAFRYHGDLPVSLVSTLAF